MVQRVTVSPSEVRGYGDIVSPKTTEDFTEYMCELSESDGVYTMAYDDTASYLRLSANPTSLQYLAPCYLYATLKVDGALAVGETVSFYEGETLLGTGETDSSGIATLYKATFTVGTHIVKAVYDELESNTVSVTVVKATTSVSLSSDKSTVFPEESFTLSGTVSRSGLLLSEVDVKIYNGNVLVDTVQTGSQGAFSKTITDASAGTNTYHAVFEGNSNFEGSTSSDVNVFVFGGSYIELEVTGDSFSTYSNTPFTYTGQVYVDWGDNTGLDEYAGGQLSHTYSSSDDYTVKIYGNITSIKNGCFYACTGLTSVTLPNNITSLGTNCFMSCTGLTLINIPSSITSLGDYCFSSCTGLSEIVLEWDSSSEILTYNSNWIEYCTSFSHFLIPEGTTSLYTAKNYPSNLLKEDGEPTPASISLTGTKNILSYADSESSVLTATVLDDNDDPVEGVSVDLYKDSVLWDTLTTGSAGTVSKTYASAGVGDVGFTAECGSLVTETYDVYDYQYYADNMQKIKNSFIADTTTASDRTIYLSSFTFSSDVEIEFKLKNIPNNWLIGFGSNGTSVNNKGVWFKLQNYNQSKASIMYVDTGGATRDVSITTDYGTSTVFTIKSENTHKIYWYLDSVVKAYRDTKTSIPLGLRFDVFNNQDYDIEYIKVKPL